MPGWVRRFIVRKFFSALQDKVVKTNADEIAHTEIFEPVLSLMHVNSVDEAIELVNSGTYGNQASLFTGMEQEILVQK